MWFALRSSSSFVMVEVSIWSVGHVCIDTFLVCVAGVDHSHHGPIHLHGRQFSLKYSLAPLLARRGLHLPMTVLSGLTGPALV